MMSLSRPSRLLSFPSMHAKNVLPFLCAIAASVPAQDLATNIHPYLEGQLETAAKRLGSHGEATWASAGGHLESGESLEECARREAMEELGVRVGNLIFLCVSNIVAYGKHYVDLEFLGDIGDQEPRLAEPEAFSEYGWFDLFDLPKPLFEAVVYALDSVKSGRFYYPGA